MTVEDALRRLEQICTVMTSATFDPDLPTPLAGGLHDLLAESADLAISVRSRLPPDVLNLEIELNA